MFLRHAEKPADHGPPLGVDKHGNPDDHALSVDGWTRAGALAALFDNPDALAARELLRPQRVMATQASDGYRSHRERDTAHPTAARLGLAVDDAFTHDQTAQAAASILADTRDTLIVWHHGSIPAFIAQLPMSPGAAVPPTWPEDRFDLIWVLTDDGSGHYSFAQHNQDLLAGDTPLA